MTYQLLANNDQVVIKDGYLCIPFVADNTDYQAYLKWLAEGNTPHSANGTTNLTPLNREAE